MVGEALSRMQEQAKAEYDELIKLMRELVTEHDAKQKGNLS